ncbi:MAG: MBL fold metallo-hydrolase [Ruminococcaceae bacterium]|jgi:flavorubredoxin/rubredoxin|nr:MBL fold metallo-hydrolase [Oscillospiraceae bacterium]
MYCVRKVNDDYTWVGADARRLAMFEGVFDVPGGISFNSYLLRDERTVLFDTVDSAVRRQFRENLLHALDGRKLDAVVVHHMEPDHTAELEDLLLLWPELEVYCSAMARNMVRQFFGDKFDSHIHVVKEGDTLTTGRHTLQFVAAPMVHWPEVLMTYDRTDRLLLTADAFGCFDALNGRLFADEVDFDRDYLAPARRYYTNIVGKYGPQVQAVLKKAAALEIDMLLPLHGFVWREDLGYILGKYDLWSRYEPEEKGVLIAYSSVYGNTESAVNTLACRLAERGVTVEMYDTSVTPVSYVLAAAFRYSHVVLATTTYNMGVFITMENLLHDIAQHNLQGRRYALIENGSWSPAAAKGMEAILEPLHWDRMAPTLTIKSALAEEKLAELEAMADALTADLTGGEEEEAEQPAVPARRWVCKVCGYVYEGEELPADFKCPLCGAGAAFFKEAENRPVKKYVCRICGFVYEGTELPDDFHCPLCNAPASQFEEKA